jgi:uncharacterized protein involved in exopolysaccharide biosynthesis
MDEKEKTHGHAMNQSSLPSNDSDYEINLADYLLVLLKRKKMIFLSVLGAVVLSAIVSLVWPKMYTATASIFPPRDSGPGSFGSLGPAGGLAASFIGGKTTADIYVGILESRTAADILIKRFNLSKLYEQNHKDNIYKILADRTQIEASSKSEIISVSVRDPDPQRAADMANTYVEALDHINRTANITAGHRKRVFLENRLKEVRKDLSMAEMALKEFQEKYNLVAIEAQARATIERAAKIKGEIIAAETELEVLKEFFTESQAEAVLLKSRISELKNQLAKMEQGNPGKEVLKDNPGGEDPNLFIPLNELPALEMQHIRLMREAQVQEKVFGLVTSQYEMAKIEEAKDIDTIQVLDPAVPPERISRPKRKPIIMLSAVVAFCVAVFVTFFLGFIDRLKTEDHDRYQKFVDNIRFGTSK